jgi:flagellar biosynthesis anti-sigma factor FlgM|tara:strand:- start:209 stop:574 length:366 start_codon:yes stop_codon:yes gene_type:complete
MWLKFSAFGSIAFLDSFITLIQERNMVDSINSSNSAAVAANKAAKQASPQTAGAPNTVISGPSEPSASVEVTLSEEIRAGGETASFDEAKVKEMRQAIESGNFPLDSRRIAENFAALEQLI